MIEPGLAVLILFVGFAVSCLSGLLGIGGGIVMAPALLYLPSAFGLASLDMRQVAGLTITQGLFACLSGAWRHDRYRSVSRRLVVSMGSTIAAAALAGSVISRWVANEVLMVVFAGLAAIAAMMMWLPKSEEHEVEDPNACRFNIPLAISVAAVIGFLGGLVGQGGSFILIPLMLYALRLPTRVVIGSNLALVFLASLAGFVGKAATGQVPLAPAVLIVVAAVPGAQIGSILSHRTSSRWLRTTLAVVIALAAVGMIADVVAGG
ncbi:MAG TPA: sulfite exporter TauE/SafE family protein [Gemmatimonadales bacterium]|nr:sulfite exporter TauE/SafE family protein [Gemmatimonadales bacterium]